MIERHLYPDLQPYDHGTLAVDPLHTIYYEQCGNPQGKPVVFLHGGPGSGCDAKQRRFFDPQTYRIVLFDQRGCGRSTPNAELRDNTTWHLVADMELLRAHLGIQRWQLFGGSWGSTLALAYAQTHPERVTEMVLRGIFLLRDWEIRWYYQDGARQIFPEAWEALVAPLTLAQRDNVVDAFYEIFSGNNAALRERAAQAWSLWEGSTAYLRTNPAQQARHAAVSFAIPFATIECHYFQHRGFLQHNDQLLHNVTRIQHIPVVLVQGRYDMICPPRSAWELHGAWPGSRLHWVDDAGHAAYEAGTVSALVRATDGFASAGS